MGIQLTEKGEDWVERIRKNTDPKKLKILEDALKESLNGTSADEEKGGN